MYPEGCPYQHTRKINNAYWVQGDYEQLMVRRYPQRPTQVGYYTICVQCRGMSMSVPKTVWEQWKTETRHEVIEESGRALLSYTRNDDGTREPLRCCHKKCDRTDTENHHFAPRKIFGDGADNWPVLPVCRFHHEHWHKMVDSFDPYLVAQDGDGVW